MLRLNSKYISKKIGKVFIFDIKWWVFVNNKFTWQKRVKFKLIFSISIKLYAIFSLDVRFLFSNCIN